MQDCEKLLTDYFRQVLAGPRPYITEALSARDLVAWVDIAKRLDFAVNAKGIIIEGAQFLPVDPHHPKVRPGAHGVVVSKEISGVALLGLGVPAVRPAPYGTPIVIRARTSWDQWAYQLADCVLGNVGSRYKAQGSDGTIWVAPAGAYFQPYIDQWHVTPVSTQAAAQAGGNIIGYLETGGRDIQGQLPALMASGQIYAVLSALDKERHAGGFFSHLFKSPMAMISLAVAVVALVAAVVAIGVAVAAAAETAATSAAIGAAETGGMFAGISGSAVAGDTAAAIGAATEAGTVAVEGGLSIPEIQAAYTGVLVDAAAQGVAIPPAAGAALDPLPAAAASLDNVTAVGVPQTIIAGVEDAAAIPQDIQASTGIFITADNGGTAVPASSVGAAPDGTLQVVTPDLQPAQGVFVDQATATVAPAETTQDTSFAGKSLRDMAKGAADFLRNPLGALTKDLPPLQRELINGGAQAASLANQVRGLVDPHTPPLPLPMFQSRSTGAVYDITGARVPVSNGVALLPSGHQVPVEQIPTDTQLAAGGIGGGASGLVAAGGSLPPGALAGLGLLALALLLGRRR